MRARLLVSFAAVVGLFAVNSLSATAEEATTGRLQGPARCGRCSEVPAKAGMFWNRHAGLRREYPSGLPLNGTR